MIHFGTCLIDKKKEPCVICGKPTGRVDYCYEQRICSKACQKVMDERYEEIMEEQCYEVFS